MKLRSTKPNREAQGGKIAALGLRAHSGWAALVAIGGSHKSPIVLDRRRIELTEPGIVKQPYHAVEDLPLQEADEYIRKCIQGTRALARKAFGSVLKDLRKKGHRVSGCGVLQASGRPLPPLEKVLVSHPLLHTAEGEMFRNALIHAAEHFDLALTRIRERELIQHAQDRLHMTMKQLQNKLTEMGKPMGSPWTHDQKFSALVAWIALAERK